MVTSIYTPTIYEYLNKKDPVTVFIIVGYVPMKDVQLCLARNIVRVFWLVRLRQNAQWIWSSQLTEIGL
jgi:hypothetical protein